MNSRLPLLGSLVFVGFLGAVTISWIREAPQPPSVPKVRRESPVQIMPRASLARRDDGRWPVPFLDCPEGTIERIDDLGHGYNTFSQWCEKWNAETGARELHGASVMWEYSDPPIRVLEGSYRDGLRDGTWRHVRTSPHCVRVFDRGVETSRSGSCAGTLVSEGARCDSPETLARAESLLTRDPLAAVEELAGSEDCDEKLALMHAAEVAIADRAQEDYYYQGKVRPRDRYGRDPNPFTRYVLEHIDRFESAGETADIRAKSFWLDQIQDRGHPALGLADLAAIRSFDYWAWEDGDGSRHTEKLLARYRAWLEAWPEHPQVDSVRRRITELREAGS